VTELQGRAQEARDGERDDLTATLSRPAFIAALRERAALACRAGRSFGLCIVDLDHFKNINLSHGPTCGDDALRDVAQRLVRTIASNADDGVARVGRYDGSAFAAIVEAESAAELEAAAELLRLAVETERSTDALRLSASVGAVLARIGEPADVLLVRAEQTLHLAKQFGRNRVEIGRSPAALRDSSAPVAFRRSA